RSLAALGMTALLIPGLLRAQGAIVGRVLDAATSEPRAGTGVAVVGTFRGAIADADGRFVIPAVPAGTVTLRARLFGFKAIERVVAVRDNDTVRVEFRLEPEPTVLGAVRSEARPVERDMFESRPSVGTVQI